MVDLAGAGGGHRFWKEKETKSFYSLLNEKILPRLNVKSFPPFFPQHFARDPDNELLSQGHCCGRDVSCLTCVERVDPVPRKNRDLQRVRAFLS